MSKVILKKTNRKVAVKVYGTGVSETISLATDCITNRETLDTTQEVNILQIIYSGAPGATATITRNGVIILSMSGDSVGSFDFNGSDFTESIENSSDIVVTTTGLMQVYLVLRKDGGYLSNIDDGLSIYDNPNLPGV